MAIQQKAIHIFLQVFTILTSAASQITFFIETREQLLQENKYDEVTAFMNQMFLFGEVFKIMLFALAMVAIYLNTRAYMYYAIIIFQDIIVETLMVTTAILLEYKVGISMGKLIVVIITGVLAQVACIVEIVLGIREAKQQAKSPATPAKRLSSSGSISLEKSCKRNFGEDIKKAQDSKWLTAAMILNVCFAILECVIGYVIGPLGDQDVEGFNQEYAMYSFLAAFILVPFPIIIALCCRKNACVRWWMLACYGFGQLFRSWNFHIIAKILFGDKGAIYLILWILAAFVQIWFIVMFLNWNGKCCKQISRGENKISSKK